MLRLFMPFDFCDQTVLFSGSLMHGNPLWYVVRGHAMLAVDGADEFWEEFAESSHFGNSCRGAWQFKENLAQCSALAENLSTQGAFVNGFAFAFWYLLMKYQVLPGQHDSSAM